MLLYAAASVQDGNEGLRARVRRLAALLAPQARSESMLAVFELIETIRWEGLDPLNLNEDDLFETVKPLALNAADIDRLNNDLLPVVKTLRFTQRRGNGNVTNDYTVTFSFSV